MKISEPEFPPAVVITGASSGIGRACALHLSGLEELGDVLTMGRVARGYTQQQLAEKLGIQAQQIQKYEATAYSCASLERIIATAKAIQIHIEADIPLKPDSTTPLPCCAARTRAEDCPAPPPEAVQRHTPPWVLNPWVLKKSTGMDLDSTRTELAKLIA